MPTTTCLTANALLATAIAETKKLKSGEIFIVRDLFKGYEWNRIPRNERLLLGTLFLHHVKNSAEDFKEISKTSSGQQKYQKL